MIYEELPRGRAKITSYVPTLPAIRYLHCCTTAGWHCCNKLYSQSYAKGVNELLLIYTANGAGRIEIDKRTYTLPQDSILLVPPHTPMKYATDPQVGLWEFYWLDLTGERACSCAERLWQDGSFLIRNLPSLASVFSDLLNEALSETERSALIERIFEKCISEAVFEASRKESVVDRILHYIGEHYQEAIDLNRMSHLFFLSKNQIIRIVRTRTGYTPHEYLIRLRMTKACELLQSTERAIEEIGHSVGYRNNSHFSATFRRFYGISPTDYRSQFSKR